MLERRAARGQPTPAIDNQPELFPDILPVWELFWQLHIARRYSHGVPSALAVVDIAAALDIEDVARNERATWHRLLRVIDLAWLEDAADRQVRKQEQEAKKKAGKGHNSADATSRDRRSGCSSRGR